MVEIEVTGLVYKKISEVSAKLLELGGISKDRKNAQQGYNFRGIDEVMNHLSPILSSVGLIILPRCITRTCSEKPSKNGGTLFYSVVEVEFDFIAVTDGSKHTVRTFGEAMDSGDKSTNKAMSAAYKYAAFQAFCIPTEGTPDADQESPAPATQAGPKKPQPDQSNAKNLATIRDAYAKYKATVTFSEDVVTKVSQADILTAQGLKDLYNQITLEIKSSKKQEST